jgi:hypothetical protein
MVSSLFVDMDSVNAMVAYRPVVQACVHGGEKKGNSRTRPRVNRVLRNQLAGDVLKVVAYRLRCKLYFCHLTCAVHDRTAACVAAGGGIF